MKKLIGPGWILQDYRDDNKFILVTVDLDTDKLLVFEGLVQVPTTKCEDIPLDCPY